MTFLRSAAICAAAASVASTPLLPMHAAAPRLEAPATAAAQVDPLRIPGSWKPFGDVPRGNALPPGAPPWLTREHVEAMRARLAEIAAVFQKTPLLASPVGFTIFPKRQVLFQRASTAPLSTDRRWAVPGRLMLSAALFEPDGRTVYDTASAFAIAFDANDLACVFDDGTPWAVDAESTMYLEPPPAPAKIHGFPAYPYCVLITHRPQPLFTAVSQERALRVYIAKADEGVGRMREMKQLVDQAPASSRNEEAKRSAAEYLTLAETVAKTLRDQLAALDPAARNAPAFSLTRPIRRTRSSLAARPMPGPSCNPTPIFSTRRGRRTFKCWRHSRAVAIAMSASRSSTELRISSTGMHWQQLCDDAALSKTRERGTP